MLRNFAIAFTSVAALVLAANLQAQGPGGGGGGRGPGGMGGPGGGLLRLVTIEQVQKELELDADQKEKLVALNKDVQAQQAELRNLSREERQTKQKEAGEKTQKALEGILLPKQLERLKQIQLQSQLAMMPGMVLASPELVKDLGLTEDQQAKIKTINEESRKAMPQFTPGERPSAEDLEKMQKAQKEGETKILDVLTADQKDKLDKLKGPKFDTSVLRRGPGGRGGNRGGGGGGAGGAGPVN